MKLQIENFRSLRDTGSIEIKPITVLIGRNSSGKSSFLRTFPLLKQSVEERTKSPILMYGRFVDFGSSYEDLKPHFSNDNGNYTLSFTFDEEFSIFLKKRASRYSPRKIKPSGTFELKYSIEFEEDRKNLLRIKSAKISFENNQVIVIFNHEKNRVVSIKINDLEVVQDSDEVFFSRTGEFVPNIFIKKNPDFESR